MKYKFICIFSFFVYVFALGNYSSSIYQFSHRSNMSLAKLLCELKVSLCLYSNNELSDEDQAIINKLDSGLELIKKIDIYLTRHQDSRRLHAVVMYHRFFSLLSQNTLKFPHQIRSLNRKCHKIREKLNSQSNNDFSIKKHNLLLIDIDSVSELVGSVVCDLCMRDMGIENLFFDYTWHRPKEFLQNNQEIAAIGVLSAAAYCAYKLYWYYQDSLVGKIIGSDYLFISQDNSVTVQQVQSITQTGSSCGFYSLLNGILMLRQDNISSMHENPEAMRAVVSSWQNYIREQRGDNSYNNLLGNEIEALMQREQIIRVREPLQELGINVDELNFNQESGLLSDVCVIEHEIRGIEADPNRRSSLLGEHVAYVLSDLLSPHAVNVLYNYRTSNNRHPISIIAHPPGHWVTIVSSDAGERQIQFLDSLNCSAHFYAPEIRGITSLLFGPIPIPSAAMREVVNLIAQAEGSVRAGLIPRAYEEITQARQAAQAFEQSDNNFREIRIQLDNTFHNIQHMLQSS